MFKSPNSEKVINLGSIISSKVTDTGKKTVESDMVKKTISIIGVSSKDISTFTNVTTKSAIAVGKKTIESERVKKAINYVEASSREVISESKKIASNVIFNVSIVAILFFSVNIIFMIYGVWILFTEFAYFNLLLILGLIIGGITFSGLAAFKCYKYAQFKIGLGVYHLFTAFFKNLITTCINELELHGSEKLKKHKIHEVLKKNGNSQIQSSNFKVPGIVRKPVLLLFEFLPFGDIIVEIVEESKRKVSSNMEDQVMKRMDTFVSDLKPHKRFTNFIVMTLVANIVVMGFLVNWM
ncbi:hypothetical protein [Gillisia hiemivivida]|uniref:Uncharacterized protein n=1 Tax=Gillisia hiemivivida TaxID=291190 RepID=A0A5C6ZSI4_9FLAO|nr:hypothetical protein [Gillisia hiemivivida]TXD93782.1 hypothetical protein ES724_08980 [Gillisia hiemivivida]